MRPLLKYLVFLISLICCKSEIESFGELPCKFTDFSGYYVDSAEVQGLSNEYILIGIEKEIDSNRISEFVRSKNYLDNKYHLEINSALNYAYKYLAVKLHNPSNCNEITWILDDLKRDPIISFAHYTLNTANCSNLVGEPIADKCIDSYSNILYVKLKNISDSVELKNAVAETNTKIKGQDKFMPLWFTLYVDKDADQELFEMKDYFDETNLFEHVNPDIIKLAVE